MQRLVNKSHHYTTDYLV